MIARNPKPKKADAERFIDKGEKPIKQKRKLVPVWVKTECCGPNGGVATGGIGLPDWPTTRRAS